jgi:hypothetical protein
VPPLRSEDLLLASVSSHLCYQPGEFQLARHGCESSTRAFPYGHNNSARVHRCTDKGYTALAEHLTTRLARGCQVDGKVGELFSFGYEGNPLIQGTWQLRAPLWGRGAAAPLVALRTT